MLKQAHPEQGRSISARCPKCAYELLHRMDRCSECGTGLDYRVLCSEQFQSGILKTRSVCLYGIIGWIVVGFGICGVGVFISVFNNGWSGSSLSTSQVVVSGVIAWGLVLPVVLCLFRWRQRARYSMYLNAVETGVLTGKCSLRVITIALPGIVIGSVIGILVLVKLFNEIVY